MSNGTSHTILKEVINLIGQSCLAKEADSATVESFHRALLKKYFEAESVLLDRVHERITLELNIDQETNETTIVDVDVNFDQFDNFLKSCVDEKKGSTTFYKNMLRYYHIDQPTSV